MPGADSFQVVFCTTGSDEQAEAIARALVERRLAACVNIVGQTCSVYRWQGRVVREGEILLVIKTRVSRFEAVRSAIRELHSYDIPEVIAVPLSDGDADYLAWLEESID